MASTEIIPTWGQVYRYSDSDFSEKEKRVFLSLIGIFFKEFYKNIPPNTNAREYVRKITKRSALLANILINGTKNAGVLQTINTIDSAKKMFREITGLKGVALWLHSLPNKKGDVLITETGLKNHFKNLWEFELTDKTEKEFESFSKVSKHVRAIKSWIVLVDQITQVESNEIARLFKAASSKKQEAFWERNIILHTIILNISLNKNAFVFQKQDLINFLELVSENNYKNWHTDLWKSLENVPVIYRALQDFEDFEIILKNIQGQTILYFGKQNVNLFPEDANWLDHIKKIIRESIHECVRIMLQGDRSNKKKADIKFAEFFQRIPIKQLYIQCLRFPFLVIFDPSQLSRMKLAFEDQYHDHKLDTLLKKVGLPTIRLNDEQFSMYDVLGMFWQSKSINGVSIDAITKTNYARTNNNEPQILYEGFFKKIHEILLAYFSQKEYLQLLRDIYRKGFVIPDVPERNMLIFFIDNIDIHTLVNLCSSLATYETVLTEPLRTYMRDEVQRWFNLKLERTKKK